MEEILKIMEQYDVLVLPSLHDGWGAVVNEALTLGLYVICSDHCGAKMLLKNPMNGTVFMSDSAPDLMNKLQDCIVKVYQIRTGVHKRTLFNKKHISGEAVAGLFWEQVCS